MLKRTLFTMSEKDHAEIKAKMAPLDSVMDSIIILAMLDESLIPEHAKKICDDAWIPLAEKMGFDYRTVQLTELERSFTAMPIPRRPKVPPKR